MSEAGREAIEALANARGFAAATRERALALAGHLPNSWQWQRFLDRTLLVLAVMMGAAAVIFWIAYNWNGMSRFMKLGLVEVALIAAAIFAARQKPRTLASQASLLLAVMILGGLLALVGQTYQTGADTYELFAVWAALSLPWVALTRWRIAWCVWVVLVNVAMQFYFANVWRPTNFVFFDSRGLMAHLLLNAGLLWLTEAWGRKALLGEHHTLERLLALLCLLATTFAYAFAVHAVGQGFTMLVAVMAVAAMGVSYRYWRLDVLALAMVAATGIAIVVATLLRVSDSSGSFFLMGLVVIGLSAGAAVWLRQLLRSAHTKIEGAM